MASRTQKPDTSASPSLHEVTVCKTSRQPERGTADQQIAAPGASKRIAGAGSAQTVQWLRQQSYQGLSSLVLQQAPHAGEAENALRLRSDTLWQEVSSRVARNGGGKEVAALIADELVGVDWDQRLEKARIGELDEVYNGALRAAIRCARSLLASSEHSVLMHKLQKKIAE